MSDTEREAMESPGEQITEHESTTPIGHVGSLVNADTLGASILRTSVPRPGIPWTRDSAGRLIEDGGGKRPAKAKPVPVADPREPKAASRDQYELVIHSALPDRERPTPHQRHRSADSSPAKMTGHDSASPVHGLPRQGKSPPKPAP